MYERFTETSRALLWLTNEQAHRMGHEYIGTEHILLAMTEQKSGIGAQVLGNLIPDLGRVRTEVEALIQNGTHRAKGKLPLMPRAKKVIEYSLEEASHDEGSQRVTTGQMLVGLIREEEGIAARVLAGLGVTRDAVRNELARLAAEGVSEP